VEGIFLGGSLLAAFLAGGVALFAPCCIVFMFPTYLAAAVRNRRWRLVPLTLIFAAGLATVLVPVTLGIGFITRSLLQFHGPVYILGGILLLVLAAVSAMGITWALPMMRGAPDVQRTDSAGVYALGVFSGAASACCAPVLAGVVTLSAVAPNLVQGTAIGLAYVFGMVFPLLLMTVAWDRLGLGERAAFRGREVAWSLWNKTFKTNTLNLLSSALFVIMGAVLIVVGVTGVTVAPTFQEGVGRWLENLLAPVVRLLEPVPDLVVGLVLVGLAVGAVAISGRRRHTGDDDIEEDQEERSCHEQSDETADATRHH
jgi:cytochrome c biogenesis protein CcdA